MRHQLSLTLASDQSNSWHTSCPPGSPSSANVKNVRQDATDPGPNVSEKYAGPDFLTHSHCQIRMLIELSSSGSIQESTPPICSSDFSAEPPYSEGKSGPSPKSSALPMPKCNQYPRISLDPKSVLAFIPLPQVLGFLPGLIADLM